jgi:hypothetical protein
MINGAFSSSCCAFRFGLPLDSRLRGNDDENQGGWHEGLLRKSHDSGSILDSQAVSTRRQWILSKENLGHAAPLSPRYRSGLVEARIAWLVVVFILLLCQPHWHGQLPRKAHCQLVLVVLFFPLLFIPPALENKVQLNDKWGFRPGFLYHQTSLFFFLCFFLSRS